MPTQFVRVRFPTKRLVYVDGEKTEFRTNEVFPLGEGTHLFDLGPRRNYAPSRKIVPVRRTSAEVPLELRFRRKDP